MYLERRFMIQALPSHREPVNTDEAGLPAGICPPGNLVKPIRASAARAELRSAHLVMSALVTSLGSSVKMASTWPLSVLLALVQALIWAMNLVGTSSLSTCMIVQHVVKHHFMHHFMHYSTQECLNAPHLTSFHLCGCTDCVARIEAQAHTT